MFEIENQVIGRGRFVSRVIEDLQSAFEAEVCGGLGVLQLVLQAWKKAGSTKKIKFTLVPDYKSALHAFDVNHRTVSMKVELSNIARNILAIKKECI